MKRLAKPIAAAVLLVSTAVSAGGWYMSTHRGGAQRHFESCRELPDGSVILGYQYGEGDMITTSFKPTRSAFVVSLRVKSDGEMHPAIALYGELRMDTFGGLRGLPVQHEDGTVISCSKDV